MKRVFLTLALFLAAEACARLIGPPPALAPHEIQKCLDFLHDQEGRVGSFYASGTLQARKSISSSEALFLIAGTRSPFRVKIELTHPWGQPLLHLLIDADDVKILLPPEKKVYMGNIHDPAFSQYLPGFLYKDQLWGLLRGIPSPADYHRATSGEANRIDLLDKHGDLAQSITVDPATRTPIRVTYPGQGISVALSDYEDSGGVLFARKTILTDQRNGMTVERQVQEMVLNQPLPDAVFTLAVPPGYQTLPLE
jgi:hypothetical protein